MQLNLKTYRGRTVETLIKEKNLLLDSYNRNTDLVKTNKNKSEVDPEHKIDYGKYIDKFHSNLTFCWNLTAELLGFDDLIPSYAEASGDDILKGVNYASAAAGIREETGQQLVPIHLLQERSLFFNLFGIIFWSCSYVL